jgi:hypothetical protein
MLVSEARAETADGRELTLGKAGEDGAGVSSGIDPVADRLGM